MLPPSLKMKARKKAISLSALNLFIDIGLSESIKSIGSFKISLLLIKYFDNFSCTNLFSVGLLKNLINCQYSFLSNSNSLAISFISSLFTILKLSKSFPLRFLKSIKLFVISFSLR